MREIMAIVEMTKAQVIDALKREKLTATEWVSEFTGKPASEECCFCAVGAMVRAAMSPAVSTDLIVSASRDRTRGTVLEELSNVYERAVGTGCEDVGLDAVDIDPSEGDTFPEEALEAGRKAAIAYVESDFPDVVHVDIGSATPREGMRVVQ
jgi:hypothetical protein